MTADEFLAKPTERNHRAYADSVFTPAAPEYATSEILLGSAYRKLLLGKPENEVDLEFIPSVVSSIPADRGDAHTWRSILLELGGIASPARSGQRRSRALPQLMPIIPEAARHGCVLGRKGKNRWTPANLLLDVLGAGIGELEGNELLNQLGEALAVGSTDDFLARFLEDSLRHAAGSEQTPPPKCEEAQLEDVHCRAYRARSVGVSSGNPAEQFCEDLKALLALKCELTRRWASPLKLSQG